MDGRIAREALQREIADAQIIIGESDKITFGELFRRRVAWEDQHQKPQTSRTSRMALQAITRMIGADVLVCKLTAAVAAERLGADNLSTYNERINLNDLKKMVHRSSCRGAWESKFKRRFCGKGFA